MNNKEIYEKLHEVQNEFEEIPLNEEEKSMLKRTAKKISQKTTALRYKKIASIAAMFVLLVGLGNLSTEGKVWASATKIAQRIQGSLVEYMGLSSQVEKYSVALHESVEIGGKEYVIEEVVAEGQDIFMTILIPREVEDTFHEVNLSHVKVNGKKIPVYGASGGIGEVKDNPDYLLAAMKYNLGQALPEKGMVEMELLFDEFIGSGRKVSMSLDLDMEKVGKVTQEILKNKPIPGAEKIKIDSFTMSPVSQKIVLSFSQSESGYEYYFECVDQKQRKFKMDIRQGDQGQASLYFSPVTSEITADQLLEEVEEIEMTLYRRAFPKESGKMDTPYEKVGESFMVKIPK